MSDLLKLKDNPDDRKLIKAADQNFLFCIVAEVIGAMTVIFWGTVGAEMAIYFLTFMFSVFMYRSHRNEFNIPVKKVNAGTLFETMAMTVAGIPIAMLFNIIAGIFTGSVTDTASDVNVYPIWLSIVAFAVVPAVVEEFVFRGFILSAYRKVDVKAGILLSSMFFALLHFSLGSILYGFFFGVLFAMVMTATDNLAYTMIMHCLFNTVNVLLSYLNIGMIPVWIAILIIVVGLVGFIVLAVAFFKKHSVNTDDRQSYKTYRLITVEGYVTIVICLAVMVMLMIV